MKTWLPFVQLFCRDYFEFSHYQIIHILVSLRPQGSTGQVAPMCILESTDACVIWRRLAGPLVACGPLQVTSFLYRAGKDGPCNHSFISLFLIFLLFHIWFSLWPREGRGRERERNCWLFTKWTCLVVLIHKLVKYLYWDLPFGRQIVIWYFADRFIYSRVIVELILAVEWRCKFIVRNLLEL